MREPYQEPFQRLKAWLVSDGYEEEETNQAIQNFKNKACLSSYSAQCVLPQKEIERVYDLESRYDVLRQTGMGHKETLRYL